MGYLVVSKTTAIFCGGRVMNSTEKTKPTVAIHVENLMKSFRIPLDKKSGIKQAVTSFFKGKKGYRTLETLNGISFDIQKGEFFGIVGRNGSGKSTLLKLLAGVYTPDSGRIDVNGSLTPFIELGVGFNPELSGKENVFLNGALLGFSRREMEDLYEDIVDFAELHDFMEERLKNYSSGMQVRLAFSIAIRAKTDILLLDEVLAVGDMAFQKKCFDYFMQLKKEKRTVVLVTHDMSAVRQYCDRAIMIDTGRILESGRVEKVAQRYQRLFSGSASSDNDSMDTGDRWGNQKMKVAKTGVVVSDSSIKANVTYVASTQLPPPVLGFNIYNSRGMNMLEGNTIRKKVKTKALESGDELSVTWEFPNTLAAGTYSLSVSCCDATATEYYDWLNDAQEFIVEKEGNTAGFIDPEISVTQPKYSHSKVSNV